MNPMQVLFVRCQPIIHITARCISKAQDYPHETPRHITKLLEVQIVSTSIKF